LKPEAAAFLGKARVCLAKADGMIDRWPDEAGREAYLAGLHAAQALIVEITGDVVKRHLRAQRELARLTKDLLAAPTPAAADRIPEREAGLPHRGWSCPCRW
jgi:hypothetical protein